MPSDEPTHRWFEQGRFEGITQALNILVSSEDTRPAQGIALTNILPAGAVEQARRRLGTPENAARLLGETTPL